VRVHLERTLRADIRVTLDGRLLAVRGARGRRSVLVDLRGRARGVAVLHITGRTAGRRRIDRARRFATCARRRP
jgi:hypothetical protein